MTGTVVAGSCRLTFRTKEKSFELSVPADVPIADLLPTVLGYAGGEAGDLAEEGLEHGGWTLQRLGGDPLDPEGTPDSLGLRDGETLHLRPKLDALPPVHFDDLVDGLASGLRDRWDSWRPELTHWLLIGAMSAVLAGAFATLLLPGPHLLKLISAGGIALLTLIGAAAASRAVGDAAAGTALGAASVPFVAMAGFLVPTGGSGPGLFGARLLAASSAAAGAAALALAVVAASAPLFLAVGAIALTGVLDGVIVLCGAAPVSSVALLIVLVVLLSAFYPALSFRLAGLRMPPLPADAAELQEGIEPHPSQRVLARGAVAERFLAAFYLATGLVCLVCLGVLLSSTGWVEYAFAGAVCLLLVLHGRGVGGMWQRLAVVVPGVLGVLLLAFRLAQTLTGGAAVLVLLGLLVIAAGLAIASWTVPGRRLVPHWGHFADILHTLAAISLLPLALDLFGIYHTLRALAG